jgi:hypothetical protein
MMLMLVTNAGAHEMFILIMINHVAMVNENKKTHMNNVADGSGESQNKWWIP